MCGIAGFLDFHGKSDVSILKKMVMALQHRGPDDHGFEVIQEHNTLVGIGQTRLSILDLSPAGHQPMHHKHFSIVYNGEIYNFREIRADLEKLGHRFRSESDTEVILHAFEEWGADCVQCFIGMFAIVIYDRNAGEVYFFRDRAGVKPFYYYQKDGLLLFGSELKALLQHPGFEKEMNLASIRVYLDYGYIPAPHSIFAHTRKLKPGHYLVIDLHSRKETQTRYWNPVDFYQQPKFDLSYEDAKSELREILKSACLYRLVSDVPVGVFLSGGYDSTAVAAIIQRETNQQLKTFTIGIEHGQNEAPFARQTARYLDTEHSEYTCTYKEAQDLIPELCYFYDEPFADSSAIPTILVSRFARRDVKVAMSADAGDEVFAGYGSYSNLTQKLNLLNRIPGLLIPAVKSFSAGLRTVLPGSMVVAKHKIEGVGKALNKDKHRQAVDLFRLANSLPTFYQDRIFIEDAATIDTGFNMVHPRIENVMEQILSIDYQLYLSDDILTKVDRATMSTALEGREPLVDHRLLEFSARLPLDFKFSPHVSKRILKDIVHEYVPKQMMDRPKSGFSIPIYKWLRGELSEIVHEYLSPEALSEPGIFDHEFLHRQVRLFLQNKLHYSPLIWKLLMFQMWYFKWFRDR